MNEYVIAKYMRLSLDDAVTKSFSIPHQRKLLDRHIDELDIPNATVLEFIDNGHSGTNLERPAMQELLDLVRCGKVNCIIVKDFSRFSRNALESGYYIEQVFPLYGIRFVSVDDRFDTNDYKDSTGGIDVAFKFLMHEYYSKDLSKKVKSVKRVQMMSGTNIVANAIYGYRKNDVGKWEPDPVPAEIVRQIFKMALDGLSTAQIRDKLCTAKYPTPREYIEMKRGKEILPEYMWTARMVLHTLDNEQYTGSYVAGKQEQKCIGSHSKIHIDKSKWIIIPDRHPAIISKEDFNTVQEMKKHRKGSTTDKPIQSDMSKPKRPRMMRGEFIAATPIYGYARAENGKLKIDEAAAEVIRKIYETALQGLSCAEIADALSADRHPIPSEYIKCGRGYDGSPANRWTEKCVREILKNIQYTGAYVSGKILKDYETGKKYHVPKDQWILIPDKNPPIVSKEVFEKVQKMAADSRKKRKNVSPRNFLLRGMVKCGCCGYALSYDPIDNPVFRCSHTHADSGAECHKMKANVRELDETVLTIIKKQAEVVLGSDDLSGYRKMSMDERRAADCEEKIRQYEEQRQNCYEQFVQNEIENDAYQSLKKECSANIDKLKNQLAVFKQTECDKQANQKTAVIAKEILNEKATPKDIVNALVEKILVFPDNRIEILWKFANFAIGGNKPIT